MKKTVIDFEYAFSEPHTITLCRPSASEKVIVEAMKDGLKFAWTFNSLKTSYPLSWQKFPMDVLLAMELSVEGQPSSLTKWYRHESGAPYLFAEGSVCGVDYVISAIAGKTGVMVKTEMINSHEADREVHVQMAHMNGWVISNMGWIDGIHNNVLMTMNDGRADRLLVYADGADDYPMYGIKTGETESQPPMSNESFGIKANSMKKISAHYTLQAGERKQGYFCLPYKKYFEELEQIKALDYEKEMAAALKEWERLLDRGTKIQIEDAKLIHCYRSCVADLFVMREKIGKYTGVVCGTNVYRSPNSVEPLETDMLLDTIGYTKEAVRDYRMYFEGQDADGCWVTRKGWEHEAWGLTFNKANAVMEHYYITRDKDFLEENYKRMYASTVFNHKARQSTRNLLEKAGRGLMPRGMGDCGMMNNGDYYGIFYPHNCLSVAADGKTLEAARILGKTEDIAFLTMAYEQAKEDLLASMRENLVQEDGYTVIPSVPNVPMSSTYGSLYAFYPCGLVSADEPMILETVKFIQGKQISEGGLPIGTGWQKQGLWVAMALNNFARAYLRMGKFDEARKFLYPALNHASLFVTWCEERGAEKGSKEISGDLQHLWTPLSVCQYLTEALFFEDEKAVHICAGICPEWLAEGKKIAVKGYKSHYGNTDFVIENRNGEFYYELKTERPIEKEILMYLPGENGMEPMKAD
jgi:tetratricopeptide (TPR) repeat protein